MDWRVERGEAWVCGGEAFNLTDACGFQLLADAAEAPVGVGHFTDEAGVGEVLGGEVLGQVCEEGLVLGGVVTRYTCEEDGLGAEAVAEMVA